MMGASMKVPPKRKGNGRVFGGLQLKDSGLNESPSQKEGKFFDSAKHVIKVDASMKVPPKRKGNLHQRHQNVLAEHASMKVPPKRKGNSRLDINLQGQEYRASMKVPPKRKGNLRFRR